MQKDRGFRALAIAAICISIIGFGIGYATLQETLTLTTKVTIPENSWVIEFTNVSAATTDGSATELTAPVTSATQITVDVQLVEPGDSVVYTFDVENNGLVDAKLSALPVFTTNTANVTCTLTHADDSALVVNETLAKTTGVQSMKLTITYDAAATSANVAGENLELTATLVYVQA